MREKLKFQVIIEMDFDVVPGEWQSARDYEENEPDTPKVLHTVDEIAEDIAYCLDDSEYYDDMVDSAVYHNVVKVRRIP